MVEDVEEIGARLKTKALGERELAACPLRWRSESGCGTRIRATVPFRAAS
jgi:hypothetical protein